MAVPTFASATMTAMPIAPSLAPAILKRPWLTKLVMPIADWYCNASGYRQMGLR